jgi:acyl dehydratase
VSAQILDRHLPRARTPSVKDETMPTDDELKQLIGKPIAKTRVVVERGPVANFAVAVGDDNPIYQNPEAAKAAGLPAVPAPPTFSFVVDNWGKFPEIQPEDAPEGGLGEVLALLMRNGGMILHGEQEFTYHRPVFVGDVLLGEGTVVDAYAKESKGKVMTFVVTETVWRDEAGNPVVTSRFNVIHRA